MLGSDQLGAACPTRALSDDEAFESPPFPCPHAVKPVAAITSQAILLSICRIADRLKVKLHLTHEFAHFGKMPLFPHVA